MNIGDVIRKIRTDKDWNQERLATESGVSQQGISKIERGLVAEPKTIMRLAKALGITADELASRADLPPSISRRTNTRRNQPVRSQWPFSFPYERFAALDEADRLEIESALLAKIAEIMKRPKGQRGRR